jgi:hypothetical protein
MEQSDPLVRAVEYETGRTQHMKNIGLDQVKFEQRLGQLRTVALLALCGSTRPEN